MLKQTHSGHQWPRVMYILADQKCVNLGKTVQGAEITIQNLLPRGAGV